MSYAPSTAATDPSRPAWRGFLSATLRYVLICIGIGAFLTGLQGGRGFVENSLYSLCIGLSCAGLIEAGRRLMALWLTRNAPGGPNTRWPGWPGMAVVIVLGVSVGYLVGSSLAATLVGRRLPLPWQQNWQISTGSLTISLTAAVIATYVFWLRGRVEATRADAEAAQRLAAQTQLKLLESQLEPHMLFNTLANLRALISLDAPRAQAMLDHLIAYLRSTLAASRAPLHPLAAEFERTADYLALMQVRLGERLVTALELPADLATQPVPPLLLQPLVENAIQHGIEPARGGGRIEVKATRVGSQLRLTVQDSGVGLAATAPPTDGEGHGFGTTQVRERLATLYGVQAGLRLEAATGGGTLATITLPLQT